MMPWLVTIFVVLGILALGAYGWFRRKPRVSDRPTPEVWSVSSPKVTLKGIRYRNPGFPPLLLIHGYAGNTRNWRDMGYALFEQGFDIWMSNLRGHGKGDHRSVVRVSSETHSFDAIAADDIRLLVDHVVGATGRKVALVTHSMGGIAARAYLSGVVRDRSGKFIVDPERARQLAKEKVTALVLMGSPPHFRNCSPAVRFLLKQPKPLVELIHQGIPIPGGNVTPTTPDAPKAFGWLRDNVFSRVVGGLSANSIIRGIVNVTNFNPATAELPRLVQKGVSKVHVDLVRDIQRWMGEGNILSRDGFDFSRAEAISVPMLFVAGEYDGLAPWKDVFDASDRHGIHAPTWKILVRRTSHVDLIAGERAARLLAPWLARFIKEPSSLGNAGSRIEL